MNIMPKHNYIDKWTCIAMMNKNCSLLEGSHFGFKKTKNGSKVAAFSFDYQFDSAIHKQVSWLYLDEQPDKAVFKNAYSLEEIVSKIEVDKWFWDDDKRPAHALSGSDFIEWRGTTNKWSKMMNMGKLVIEPLSELNIDATLEMIEKWRFLDNGGMKYGWQERAGCDKALVNRYVNNYEGIQEYVSGTVFRLNDEVVGYSCIEKTNENFVDGIPEFKYLTRKALNIEGRRNLTEFIDYKTIELIHKNNSGLREYLVNWGASSGGVHWYKSHKFPIYSKELKWFCSRKA